jgi:hypothetical protein
VDGGQGLDRGQGLEVNGRQEVEVDGEQDVEQDVDCGQKVNGRQRRVGDEYAIDGIRLQSRRKTPADIKCIAYQRAICDVCN